ncbi:MAG TPA: hypothetical protein VFH46_19160, partial [Pyrinomonadaceae bacterium]|nr:hypothetical protein [Pyrinomonadaceae bacterium]
MSIFTKLNRRLPALLVLLIGICLIVEATRAQQITQQPTQRPRRVNGTEQTTEAKKGSDEVDEGDVVRVDTQLVSIPAVVTDSSGRPLAGLRPENFRITE